jgi:hypothetical protein
MHGEGEVPTSYPSLCQTRFEACERRSETESLVRFPSIEPNRVAKTTYRLHKDDEHANDQSDHGCVSLAGIIKIQPNRRKGNKTWRPMQASDLGESGSDGGDVSFQSNDTRHANGQLPVIALEAISSVLRYPFYRSHTISFVPPHNLQAWDHLGDRYDGTNTIKNFTTSAQASSEGNHPSKMYHGVAEPHIKLFGKLPDPIRLHEQEGKFDGQVVFIGHPNRDISAHQWSSSSFQWVNIGRYVRSHGKVEGSLASDCLRGIDELHDTLEYFKLAAENRETLVIEHGRPKEYTTTAGHLLHTTTNAIVSEPTHPDTSIESLRANVNTQNEVKASLHLTAHASRMKQILEDPFVAAASPSKVQLNEGNQTESNLIGLTGSLDLTYQFPMKVTMSSPPDSDYAHGADSIERSSTEHYDLNSISAPILPEIAFGEEAATKRRTMPEKNELPRRFLSDAVLQAVGGREQFPNNSVDSQPTIPAEYGIVSKTSILDPVSRCAVPTPLATSVHYGVSSLSANAVSYTNTHTAAAESRASESNASTINATAVGLHYSDPDGLHKSRQYEVANGLNQQAPTLQSFKGPFFAESKPTTHDPTAALSIQISDEDKLMNWFRDGHRPSRQREYTKSLIAAAMSSGRGRCFGAVGETSAMEPRGPYANTAPFVRLYENLSEYMEEHRNGSGHSYFTRRWKPAPPQYRALGPDDNTSYFSKRNIAPHLPREALFLRRSKHVWG